MNEKVVKESLENVHFEDSKYDGRITVRWV
jgi:hypothetical protein